MLLTDNVHPSWKSFLTDEIRLELKKVKENIGHNYNPTNSNHILRFLSVDLNNVKVIWLGQDVYPAKAVATGRSFEVGGLTSWNHSFRQVSVKNIIRLIYKNYYGIREYEQIKGFNAIKKDINSGEFPIKGPLEWFDSLEEQGVLFLNTSFTCEIGEANSHKSYWENFSSLVIQYISKFNPNINWFLWGKEAANAKKHIIGGTFFESRHPMMCSSKYPNDFLKSSCFLSTWDEVNWLG